MIVVDDGSRDAEAVVAAVRSFAHARLLRRERTGAVPARNAGVRSASTPIVLLLDDDCLPQPGWAAALVSRIESGAAVAAAGRAVNADRDDVFGEATQVVLDHLTAAASDDGSTAFAPTMNLAAPRELLLGMPFDEQHDNSGADRDWCARLTARGLRITLVPDAVVVHRQRLDLESFVRKHYRYGWGSSQFRRRHRLRLERPGFYVELVLTGFRRGVRVGAAVCLAQLATGAGFAAETLDRRRS